MRKTERVNLALFILAVCIMSYSGGFLMVFGAVLTIWSAFRFIDDRK